MEERLLSVKEVADRFGVSDATIRRMVKEGHIAALRFGRQWRVKPGEVERILAEGIQIEGKEPVIP